MRCTIELLGREKKVNALLIRFETKLEDKTRRKGKIGE